MMQNNKTNFLLVAVMLRNLKLTQVNMLPAFTDTSYSTTPKTFFSTSLATVAGLKFIINRKNPAVYLWPPV